MRRIGSKCRFFAKRLLRRLRFETLKTEVNFFCSRGLWRDKTGLDTIGEIFTIPRPHQRAAAVACRVVALSWSVAARNSAIPSSSGRVPLAVRRIQTRGPYG